MGAQSVNIPYLLLLAQNAAADWHAGDIVSAVPSWATLVLAEAVLWGLVATLILVILLVYVQIRLVMVEHEGFHALEERHTPEAEAVREGGNERWEHVVALASSDNHADWRRAILDADIMLGSILAERGYPGESVGEQLRLANPFQMTTLDAAWKAHKVRNDIAHQGESYELTERDVRSTVDHYRRVFEEFGAI